MGLIDIGNHSMYVHNKIIGCLKKEVYHFDAVPCIILRPLLNALSKFVTTTDPEIEEIVGEHIKEMLGMRKTLKASYIKFFDTYLDPSCEDETTINRIKYFY